MATPSPPTIGSTPRRAGKMGAASRKRRACVAAAALLAIVSSAVVASPAAGQAAEEGAEVRIVARKLPNDRVEFGLQQRHSDGTWGDRQLPRVRFFPPTARVNRWLASSPLHLTGAEVRIVARKLPNDRVEFGLQQRHSDGTWGDRQLPRVRFFPPTARVNRWLASSPLALTAPQTAVRGSGDAQARPANAATISAGLNHTCGIKTDRTVVCWGDNEYGQSDAPSGAFAAIAAGTGHSCGIKADQAVVCWGDNDWSQLNAPAGAFTAISSGHVHSCAIRADGTVACWGHNGYGQLDAPTGVFTAISAGGGHSCGVRADRTAQCWGASNRGQANAPDGAFTAVSVGTFHSCGLRTDRTAQCWGYYDVNSTIDTEITDGLNDTYVSVASGIEHVCGLSVQGEIDCHYFAPVQPGIWVGGAEIVEVLAAVVGAKVQLVDAPEGQFNAIDVGESHSCAIRTDGTAVCWGHNTKNQLDAPAETFALAEPSEQ